MPIKKLLYFFLLIGTFNYGMDFRTVDDKVKQYPYFSSLDHLGIRIMNDFQSDAERVRAAFIWIVYNMDYGRSYESIFQADQHYPYYSEIGKRYQLRQLEIKKIEQSFRERLGVCLDYSLILKELCTIFRIPSEIVIGVAKNEIRDLKGNQLLKNHTWNAVLIDGEWRLADPTWAAGQMNSRYLRLFGNYADHFFFTDPSDFIKTHLPANPSWQLLEDPVEAEAFARAPSYFPEYFEKKVELSSKTSGIISLSEYNEYLIVFDKLPELNSLHYATSDSKNLKKLNIAKSNNHPYISKIKLKKKLKKQYTFLTVFMDYKPILKFKVEN